MASDDRSVLLTVDEWLACEVSPDDLPERDGPVVLGIDLGGSRSMSAAALYWPDTGRLECVGAFPCKPGLADRGQADGVGGRYIEMRDRGELVTMGDATVPVARFMADIATKLDGQSPAAIVGDRFRHTEFLEALRDAGLDRVPFIWRGFGWKDGSEDCERLRLAVFGGEVKTVPSLLLRSAFSDAITLVDPAGNHKLAALRAGSTLWRQRFWLWLKGSVCAAPPLKTKGDWYGDEPQGICTVFKEGHTRPALEGSADASA